MSRAYSSRNLSFPLDTLQAILLYKTREQAKNDCRHYGISVMDDDVVFSKETFLPNAHVSYITLYHICTSARTLYHYLPPPIQMSM
jgi:Nuclear protein export factor